MNLKFESGVPVYRYVPAMNDADTISGSDISSKDADECFQEETIDVDISRFAQ